MGIKESFRRLRKRREIKMGKSVCYEMKTRTKCQIIKTKNKKHRSCNKIQSNKRQYKSKRKCYI